MNKPNGSSIVSKSQGKSRAIVSRSYNKRYLPLSSYLHNEDNNL